MPQGPAVQSDAAARLQVLRVLQVTISGGSLLGMSQLDRKQQSGMGR